MEKKPFIGSFTGFLYVGEEKAEFDGKKLVSYYAKPYCSNPNAAIENCIEFRTNQLIIRDVHSPDGEQYDCIWGQEDIESLLDKLGTVSDYHIEKVCCGTIRQLVIPSVCIGIADDAFDDCPKLKKMIYFGNELPILKNQSISIVGVSDYTYHDYDESDEYASSYYTHIGVHQIYDPDTECVIGCFISGECREIDRNDIEDAKWVFFWSRTVQIEENAIDKDAGIIGFSGSTAEAYANSHGNCFSSLDDVSFDPARLQKGITIEGDMISAKGQVYLRLTGLQQNQLAETVPGTRLKLFCEPDEMNAMRVVFRNAETGEFCGLLANRAAYTAAYLMKQGYLEFTDAVTEENGYLMATILWHEPLSEQVKLQLHLAELISNYPPYIRNLLERERDNEMVFSSVVMTAQMSSDEKKLLTDSIMLLNETDNRLSCAMARRLRSSTETGNVLSAFQYTDNNRYVIAGSSLELAVNKKTTELTCLSGDEPIALTEAEMKFAQIYVNHYRQIYHLPPIKFMNNNGGDEYGTV